VLLHNRGQYQREDLVRWTRRWHWGRLGRRWGREGMKRSPRRRAGSRWREGVTLPVVGGWWLVAVANRDLRHDVGKCRGK
jgi:hypothetical protein